MLSHRPDAISAIQLLEGHSPKSSWLFCLLQLTLFRDEGVHELEPSAALAPHKGNVLPAPRFALFQSARAARHVIARQP